MFFNNLANITNNLGLCVWRKMFVHYSNASVEMEMVLGSPLRSV